MELTCMLNLRVFSKGTPSLILIWILLLNGWLLGAEPNSLSPDELAEGWILLFDGETTYGWQVGGAANWKVADGVISAFKGDSRSSLLATTNEFGDYDL